MKMFLWLMLCLTALGCSTFQQITYSSPNSSKYEIGRFHYENFDEKYDAYSYQIYYNIDSNSNNTDSIYIKKVSFESGLVSYSIVQEYFGRDFRFMKSLVVSIDGVDTVLTDAMPRRALQRGSMVNEVLTYTVDQGFVDRLSSSSNVVFRYWDQPIMLSEPKQAVMKDAVGSLDELKYSSEIPGIQLNQ